MNAPIRIVWISDIHYKAAYLKNDQIEGLLDAIKTELKSITVDYVVLTGDLAFKGDHAEYEGLFQKIMTLFPSVPVLSIPGNHDVAWTPLSAALRGMRIELADIFEVPKGEFAGENSKFASVFAGYRWFANQLEQRLPGDLRRPEKPLKDCGYLFDEQRGVLFLQINSACYSFGDGVIKSEYDAFVERNLGEIGWKGIAEQSFLLFGDRLSQLGKQSYMLNHYPYWNDIKAIIEEHDPLVVSLAHHPPSWLRWDEFHVAEDVERGFGDLLQISDVLLTGHLHSPYIQCNVIENECIHLAIGCLLDYHAIEKETSVATKFRVSRWGVLELDETKVNWREYAPKITKSSKLKHVYAWKLLEHRDPIQYPWVGCDDDDGDDDGQIPSPPIEAKDLQDIPTFLELLFKSRRYRLDCTLKSFERNRWFQMVREDSEEVYLVCLNSLPKVPANVKDWAAVFSGEFFNDLAGRLRALGGKNVVVAFYEIVDVPPGMSSGEGKRFDRGLEAYYQGQFLSFQGLKHAFFEYFSGAESYKELAITYDCLIK